MTRKSKKTCVAQQLVLLSCVNTLGFARTKHWKPTQWMLSDAIMHFLAIRAGYLFGFNAVAGGSLVFQTGEQGMPMNMKVIEGFFLSNIIFSFYLQKRMNNIYFCLLKVIKDLEDYADITFLGHRKKGIMFKVGPKTGERKIFYSKTNLLINAGDNTPE